MSISLAATHVIPKARLAAFRSRFSRAVSGGHGPASGTNSSMIFTQFLRSCRTLAIRSSRVSEVQWGNA